MTERPTVPGRRIAIALPLRNEAVMIAACLDSIDRAAGRHDGSVTILAFANNCSDDSAVILARHRPRHARLDLRIASLLPGHAHAGWARRLALDAATDHLSDVNDLLLSTDADTLVAPDWITRTVAHVAAGADAVAGLAITRRAGMTALGQQATERLTLLGRYFTAIDYLRAPSDRGDAWPCHGYEGGASIALTLGRYRRIGGAPTPPVGEDRALFAAVRADGGRIRHPRDVRVFPSCRLHGRAEGGMADTLRHWIEQDADMPVHETYPVHAMIAPQDHGPVEPLTFRTLPAALATAQAMIRARRDAAARLWADPPQIEPIPRMPLAMDA